MGAQPGLRLRRMNSVNVQTARWDRTSDLCQHPRSNSMPFDADVVRAAEYLLKRYGADAAQMAERHIRWLEGEGEVAALPVWHEIGHALEEMQRT
jgi:hypothetical protein